MTESNQDKKVSIRKRVRKVLSKSKELTNTQMKETTGGRGGPAAAEAPPGLISPNPNNPNWNGG